MSRPNLSITPRSAIGFADSACAPAGVADMVITVKSTVEMTRNGFLVLFMRPLLFQRHR
jgi:hypothetical protein